ncbi:MAG: PIN domain-containing protein [Nanoarchaeota archaeon]
MGQSFVFDTYAVLEIIAGNRNYEKYLDANVIINNFIYAELCYTLLRENKQETLEYLRKYAFYISSLEPEWIKEAMGFRIKWKDRNVSMTDCIGYVMAKKLDVKFLTGDKEFEKLSNVEFVRK